MGMVRWALTLYHHKVLVQVHCSQAMLPQATERYRSSLVPICTLSYALQIAMQLCWLKSGDNYLLSNFTNAYQGLRRTSNVWNGR